MSDSSHIKALLTDDVVSAALRADGLDPRDFARTLESAAARLRAARTPRARRLDAAAACWNALAGPSLSRCGA